MRDDDDWQDWTATCRALATYWRAEQVSDPSTRVSLREKVTHHLDTRLMEMVPSYGRLMNVGAFEH
jgi:hypothetical protein